MIHIYSYGCKHGEFTVTDDIDVTLLPCHDIPNPHRNAEVGDMDGRDPRLQSWVMGHKAAQSTLRLALQAASEALHPTNNNPEHVVAFECIGGKHRSASLAEILHEHLTERGIRASLTHRDINR